MSKGFEGTRGKWSGRPRHDPILLQGTDDVGLSIAFACGGGGPRRVEYLSNARLIAEAGDVLDETGLTPRQLAEQNIDLQNAVNSMRATRDEMQRNLILADEQRAELLEALESVMGNCLDSEALAAAYAKARTAIANATQQRKEPGHAGEA